jgi:hypothetical protein
MHGWEDNVEMNLRGTGCEDLEEGLTMWFCELGHKHSGSIKAGNFLIS